jgi:hypothetical protein
MQLNVMRTTLISMPVLACMFLCGTASAQKYKKAVNLSGNWMEMNVAPDKAMTLNITQNGTQLTEQILGTFTVNGAIARGSQVQQCAPPFRKFGYDYTANPAVAFMTMRLEGATLTFHRELHWNTPCDGHPVGVEQDTHYFQRYP